MIECFLAWFFLIIGLFENETILFVVAALFAIAAQISRLYKRRDGE